MQYLECLSAALSDMAHTYIPAERMSVVLRAVMVELRGGPEPNHFRLYKPKSAIVPARRGSTIDNEDDAVVWKKRQTSRPRAGTNGRKARTSSMSTTMSMSGIESTGLSIKPPPPRFDDANRVDDFILVTPRDELNSWPEPPELAHALSTPSTISTSIQGQHHHRDSGTWMGAEFDTNDSISALANVHFPEMGAFDNDTKGVETMTNLDFMTLGDGGDWGLGKDWGTGTDLDGFPAQNNAFTTGMAFDEAKFIL